jgi:hypothetical protein
MFLQVCMDGCTSFDFEVDIILHGLQAHLASDSLNQSMFSVKLERCSST